MDMQPKGFVSEPEFWCISNEMAHAGVKGHYVVNCLQTDEDGYQYEADFYSEKLVMPCGRIVAQHKLGTP